MLAPRGGVDIHTRLASTARGAAAALYGAEAVVFSRWPRGSLSGDRVAARYFRRSVAPGPHDSASAAAHGGAAADLAGPAGDSDAARFASPVAEERAGSVPVISRAAAARSCDYASGRVP